jgi:hypothetical protein
MLARNGLALPGQITQEGQRFAGFKIGHRLSISLNLHRTQQPQVKDTFHNFSLLS